MRNRLEGLASEYERLSGEMGSQEVASDPSKFRVVAKAQSDLTDVVQCFQAYQLEEQRLHEAETILREESDAELCQMAEEERQTLTQSLEEREERLRFLLLPKDPNDEKNTIVEIRAGTGGEE
ncbi:MAG: PCRF domain-containing protein, partial [Candidatus Hydrogenedentes bacterium]|nr:PCRF domain-containing protein [Candidatus Hydrogenedentota bacterium]